MIPLGVAVVLNYLRKSKWVAIIAIVAGSLLFSYCKGKSAGEEKEKAVSLVSVNKLKNELESNKTAYEIERTQALVRLQTIEAGYREKENTFTQRISDVEKEYEKNRVDFGRIDRSVSNKLANGTVRMRVQTASPCLPMPESSETNTSPSGANDPNSGQLPGNVAQRLYDSAATCDGIARQVTALQDWIRAALDLCNGEG